MNIFNNVEKVKNFCCEKILPAVYDDSLSYYEVLCKLTSKCNQIIDEFNKVIDYSDETLEKATEQANIAMEKATSANESANIATNMANSSTESATSAMNSKTSANNSESKAKEYYDGTKALADSVSGSVGISDSQTTPTTTWSSNKIDKKFSEINSDLTNFVLNSNILGCVVTYPGYYINFEGAITANNLFECTDYIEVPSKVNSVKALNYITIEGGQTKNDYAIALFDSNKTYIRTVLHSTSVPLGVEEYNLTDDTKYIRVTFAIADKSDALIVWNTKNIYNYKNVILLGDSITSMGGDDCSNISGWSSYLKKNLNFKSIKSYARGGATWSNTPNTTRNVTEVTSDNSDDNVIFNQIQRLADDTDSGATPIPNLIIIACGTNDARLYEHQGEDTGHKRPNLFDTTVANTFDMNTDSYFSNTFTINQMTSLTDSIRFNVELLIRYYPDAQIIIMSPLQVASSFYSYENNQRVGDLIEGCCNRLSIPCIRQDKECAVWSIRENISHFKLGDGVHPNLPGAEHIGNYISNRVKSFIEN